MVFLAGVLASSPVSAAPPLPPPDPDAPAPAEPAPPAEPPPADGARPAPPPTPSPGPKKRGHGIEEIPIEELLDLPVVTASRGRAEPASVAAANIYTITRDEIVHHGWRSVAQALMFVPGLYVIDNLVTYDVSVRGTSGGLRSGARLVRVMINGTEVSFRSEGTAFLGPELIPIEAVERIEIARGPLSAIYGANAFLATVNIITRTPPEGVTAEVSTRLDFVRQIRNRGISATGLVMYSSEEWDLLIAHSRSRIDRSGLEVEKTFDNQDPERPDYQGIFGERSEHDLATPSSTYLSLTGRLGRIGSAMLQVGDQILDSMGEFQTSSVLTHKSRHAIRNTWVTLQQEKEWSATVSTRLAAGFSRGAPTRDDLLLLTTTNKYAFRRNFSYRALAAEASATWLPKPELALTAGVDALGEQHVVLYYTQIFNVEEGERNPGDELDILNAEDRKQVDIGNLGAFLHASGTPFSALPRLNLSGAVRLDLPTQYPAQYSLRASAAHRWGDDLVVKLVAGRAFQTPSPIMLFSTGGFGSQYSIIGTETRKNLRPLVPQTVTSAELVTQFSLAKHIGVEAALYWQNVVDAVEILPSGNNLIAQNRGERQNIGGELAGRAFFQEHRISVFASVAAQLTLEKDLLRDTTTLETRAPERYPNLMILSGASAEIPKLPLVANATARVVGERGASDLNVFLNNSKYYALPGYVSVDLVLATKGLSLFEDGRESIVSAGVTNLFDARHVEPGFAGFDIPNLGRVVFITFEQKL